MKSKLIFLSALCASGSGHAQELADLILHNGTIITVDKNFTEQRAMVVKDGRIVAVGGDELVKSVKAKLQIDLKGQAVVPGFIDNHLHIFAPTHREVDLSKTHSIAEVKRQIGAMAKALGPGEWVVGNFWDETRFAERRLPNRHDLDEAAPDNPVVMVRDGGHSVVGNSRALALVGIDRKSPDSSYVIEHDADGEPSGIVREGFRLFMNKVPKDTPEQMEQSYVRALKALLPLGLTSAVVAGAPINSGEVLGGLSWEMFQKIYGQMGSDLPRMTVQVLWPGADKLKRFPHHTGFGDDRLKLGAIGETPGVDGGMTGPTACTKNDYHNQPGFRGRCNLSDEALQGILDTAASLGWQVGIHAIGDRAIEQTVNGYVKALDRYGQKDPRWFTSHFGFLPSSETLALMKKYDISVGQQPNFLYTLQKRYVDNVDPATREHVIPVATPHAQGINVTFGSDDLPIGPILGLYAAVTRKGPDGTTLAPREAVSVRDAIRMYTINTAYLSWDEKKKGSLEAGKFADFVILDRNPLEIPADELRNLKVNMTVIGGKILYGRSGTGYDKLAPSN
jgi:predicted amidohydrolase YtcJ